MKNENFEHCKSIAAEIEKYAAGDMYRCPECGEVIEWDNTAYDCESDLYTCPHCGEAVQESDLEALGLWDFFSEVFNTEWRLDSYKEYKSVSFMIACGGPNIYVDTGSRAVELYWWSENASYPLSYDAAEAVDEFARELFEC